MTLTSDERRRLAELARQLESEAPELSRALTGPRRSASSRQLRTVRAYVGFDPRRLRRGRQVACAITLGSLGMTLAIVGLTAQLPLLFGPGLVIGSAIPLAWIVQLFGHLARRIVRYYQQPARWPLQ